MSRDEAIRVVQVAIASLRAQAVSLNALLLDGVEIFDSTRDEIKPFPMRLEIVADELDTILYGMNGD